MLHNKTKETNQKAVCGFLIAHFKRLYSGIFLSIIFTIRAIGEFNAVGFFKKIRDTEFAIYDTKYFSPLCLILGVVFAMLAYKV